MTLTTTAAITPTDPAMSTTTTRQHHCDGRQRRCVVSFDCVVQVHLTLALCDYTDEERSACFVSEDAYVEMREGAKRTVIQARRKAARAKYRKQEPTMSNLTLTHHDDSDESGGCLRGVEHLLDTSVLAKKRERRDTVRAAVLVSPHNGNGSAGVYPSVSVNSKAKAAFRAQVEAAEATFRASRDAAEVGAQDAAIAAKIHSKAMLHQDPMDMDIDTALLNARKSRRITPLCSAKVYAKSIRQDPMDIDTALLNARKFDAAADYIRSSSQSRRSSLTTRSPSSFVSSSSASDVPSLEATTVSSATTRSSISSSSTTFVRRASSVTWEASEHLMERFRSLSTRRECTIEQAISSTAPHQAEPFQDEDAAALLLRLRSVAGRHSTNKQELRGRRGAYSKGKKTTTKARTLV
uniref:Uncharacterized protein n=1 Tax=Odontella aurita TaxID=265563 RepID=A0A7S4IJM1_9STRA|mmetsp:Transcript_25907/g.76639  ORF Transcript_25907/g.76639 Transcript_25907/m.76639 type:complete len:409 (+) Transcript_25907:432-1658(+)